MKKLILLLFLITAKMASGQSGIRKTLCEGRVNPVGIDARRPGFTWLIKSGRNNTLQTAYQIQVTDKRQTAWNSGIVSSDSSVNVSYKGRPLRSGHRYFWRVRVWDNHRQQSAWSAPSYFQIGLLDISDWQARWIRASCPDNDTLRPSPVFHKTFAVTKKVRSAFAYVTAHGLYEAKLNGVKIGDAYLTPGWTSYRHRLQYQVYDLTSQFKESPNRLDITLGSGWYRGQIQALNNYGSHLALLFQLNITYTDGGKAFIGSDDSWQSATSATRYAEVYNGETYDARMAQPTKWYGVTIQPYGYDNLIASEAGSVTAHKQLKPVRIFRTPKGECVIDFGQNMVGWVAARLKGRAGDSVKLSHAEVLDKDGNFYTANLRAAKAQDIYIMDGKGPQVFRPHFSWQGFRYVKIEGLRTKPDLSDFTGIVLYSKLRQTGSFHCSNQLVNQLQHNILWSQKGNFVDIPTDCPQRDERLGWTADAQVFSRTAAFNMDVRNFFSKWMKDAAADQGQDGGLPLVIPTLRTLGTGGVAGWSDFMTIIPWNMYLAYGNKTRLTTEYPGMKKWVDYVRSQSVHDLWINDGYADWLSYNPGKGPYGTTDPNFVAQCYYAHSTQILINAAKVLGKMEDEAYYAAQLSNIKAAFYETYVNPDGSLTADTQTGYILALQFDLLPEPKRAQLVDSLVKKIHAFHDHLTTGFLGTPYICDVLTRFGKSRLAYRLLLQKTYPSWLYPVTRGATTIWERWDGIKPDGSFEDPAMNSFNHYAYGAIGDWLYRSAAGIDTYDDNPGYKHIRIKPFIGGGMTHLEASLQTSYGLVSSAWKLNNGRLQLKVIIPPNTTADIYVPTSAKTFLKKNVGSGHYTYDVDYKHDE